MLIRLLAVSVAAALCMTGCASRPPGSSSLKSAFVAPGKPQPHLDADDPVVMEPAAWGRLPRPGGLAGRTLTVSSLHDLKLRDKEVVLTFDDGPVPGKTERILATLNQYGVKATFLMVGQMAETYPAIARKVVASGQTIGSHTYRHRDLQNLAFDAAMMEIMRGEKSEALYSKTTLLADWGWTYPEYSFSIDRNLADIERIVIDPSQRMADVDPDNNAYPTISREQPRYKAEKILK